MTPTKTEETPISATETRVSSPGALIRQARERLRMTPEDLAAATKLARHQIESLERDDFNAFAEPVYVRGYYRKCAKILALSEHELLDAYQARVSPKRSDPPSKLRLASGTELGSTSRLPLPMAVAAAVMAVILSVFAWNFIKSPDELAPLPLPVETPVVQPQASPEDAAAEEPSAASALTPTLPTITPDSASTLPVSEAPALQPAPAAAETAGAATAAQASNGAAKPAAAPLNLSFAITSWARVDDANGKTLLNALMRAGENKTLNGKPPYMVFLGNAPGVKVEYNGKNVDFSKTVADNLTARFKVPAGNP